MLPTCTVEMARLSDFSLAKGAGATFIRRSRRVGGLPFFDMPPMQILDLGYPDVQLALILLVQRALFRLERPSFNRVTRKTHERLRWRSHAYRLKSPDHVEYTRNAVSHGKSVMGRTAGVSECRTHTLMLRKERYLGAESTCRLTPWRGRHPCDAA